MTQAVFVRQTGGPEVLRAEPHDPGRPEGGSVRVRVTAAGVNFLDVYYRSGLYSRPLPFIAGSEGAGVVEAVGPDARGASVGDRVAWASVSGSYAEALLAPVERLVPIPDGVSDETAAAVMLQGMTAHYLAHSVRETRPGDVALVHAAAGGVGLLLIQILKAAGARVIGTCSTDEKAGLARQTGADEVVIYSRQNVSEEVRRLTSGRGADVVYDSVGQTTFEASLRSLRPRGMLALFGQSSGPVPPFDLRRLGELGSLFVTRPSLAQYTQTRDELELRANAVLLAAKNGSLKVRVGARFSLTDAAAAHRAVEGRTTTGKILLLPS
jgi:NADPH:quinone reductase